MVAYFAVLMMRPAAVAWQKSATRHWPFTLNGISLHSLDEYADLVETHQAGSAGSLRLVLVTSDRCGYSHQDAPMWVTLMRGLVGEQSLHVTILSTSGMKIPNRLHREAVA